MTPAYGGSNPLTPVEVLLRRAGLGVVGAVGAVAVVIVVLPALAGAVLPAAGAVLTAAGAALVAAWAGLVGGHSRYPSLSKIR